MNWDGRPSTRGRYWQIRKFVGCVDKHVAKLWRCGVHTLKVLDQVFGRF